MRKLINTYIDYMDGLDMNLLAKVIWLPVVILWVVVLAAFEFIFISSSPSDDLK